MNFTRSEQRKRLIAAAEKLSSTVGKKSACQALQVARATYYRHQSSKPQIQARQLAPPLALTEQERQMVIDTLHSDRFCDLSPYQVYAQLIDEGQYLCAIRTMYRILHSVHGDVKERRRHVDRPYYQKPELLATEPNQVCGSTGLSTGSDQANSLKSVVNRSKRNSF